MKMSRPPGGGAAVFGLRSISVCVHVLFKNTHRLVFPAENSVDEKCARR